jgi:hypothetical protein
MSCAVFRIDRTSKATYITPFSAYIFVTFLAFLKALALSSFEVEELFSL